VAPACTFHVTYVQVLFDHLGMCSAHVLKDTLCAQPVSFNCIGGYTCHSVDETVSSDSDSSCVAIPVTGPLIVHTSVVAA